jgi:hypothetical protein
VAYTLTGPLSLVLPGVPVQVTAIWNSVTYPLFYGTADSWSDDGANYAGRYAEVTLNATDGFKALANAKLPALGSPAGAGEDTGSRISRILNAAGWPQALRAIDTGDTAQQATSLGSDALSLCQLAADTEQGWLYVNASGQVTFRHRRALQQDARSATAMMILGDLPGTAHGNLTELPYRALPRADDDTQLVNDVQVTIAGGSNLQEAINWASVARYNRVSSYARTDLQLQTDADALNCARYLLYVAQGAEVRFEQAQLAPRRDPADLYPHALGREIGDRVTAYRRPPGAGTATRDCLIAGISHAWAPGLWNTTWDLADASRYTTFLTLDNPVYGRLDNNALAW